MLSCRIAAETEGLGHLQSINQYPLNSCGMPSRKAMLSYNFSNKNQENYSLSPSSFLHISTVSTSFFSPLSLSLFLHSFPDSFERVLLYLVELKFVTNHKCLGSIKIYIVVVNSFHENPNATAPTCCFLSVNILNKTTNPVIHLCET